MLRTIIRKPTPTSFHLLKPNEIDRIEIDGIRHYRVPQSLSQIVQDNFATPIFGGEQYVNYPSVTTLLGALSEDGIAAWKERVGHAKADAIANRAAQRGQNLHTLCENYLLNSEVDITSELPLAHKMFKQVHPIIDASVSHIFGVEFPLWSHTLKTAGTADLICTFDGKLSILDFKTSKKVKDERYLTNYLYQCTAYALMMEEMYGVRPKQLVLIFGLEEGSEPGLVIRPIDKYVDEVRKFFQTVKRP